MGSAPWLTMGQMARRWVDAGELAVGDLIWQADGTTGVVESVQVVAIDVKIKIFCRGMALRLPWATASVGCLLGAYGKLFSRGLYLLR